MLENVSFTLRPGQMLGICGPTGSGKSTILSLIQRHFDVSEGDIRFHDVPLPRLLLDDWRSRLAVVSQTPFCFQTPLPTISRSVSDGDTRPDRARGASGPASTRIFCACRRATTRKWGGSGALCSPADKKQRISIARALLLDAEILILDDALSAVDGRTEHQILHNLRQWGEGARSSSARTVCRPHRSQRNCVLQHGHIAQRGQHEQLAGQTDGIGYVPLSTA